MKIVSVIGARPQFIKAAAVSRVLRTSSGIEEILVHTGQHYDENMSDIFFRQLDIPEPEFNLEVGSGSHAYQTGMMLKGIEDVLQSKSPIIPLFTEIRIPLWRVPWRLPNCISPLLMSKPVCAASTG